MKCGLCGYDIEEGKNICSNCGSMVETSNDWNSINNNIVFEDNNTPIDNDIKNKQNTINQLSKQSSINVLNNKKQINKTKIIILCITSIILSLIIGLILYYKIFNNSKKIYNNLIDKTFDFVLQPINDTASKTSGNISFSANINTSSNSELINIINKLQLSMDFDIDYIQQLIKVNGRLIYDNNDFQGNIVAYDNYLYINSNEIYDKYIRYPFEYKEILNTNSTYIKDYNNIIKEIKKALVLSLKEDYFTSYDDIISVNGEKVKVNNNELVINQDNYKEISKDVYTYLYNSHKFTKALSSLLKQEEKMVKDNINSSLDRVSKEELNSKINIVFNVYTKGLTNNFVGANVSYDNNALKIFQSKRNKYDLSLIYNDKTINTSITINKVNSKTTYIIDYINGNDKIELNIGLNISHHKKITKPNITNYVDYQSLTETDLENIRTKLEGNSLVNNLKRDLESIDYDSTKQVRIFNMQ